MQPTNTPRIWIGCLACYNNGKLVGDWFDANEADDITILDIHSKEDNPQNSCEELWVFDHENLPVKGEMAPGDAAPWGDAYDELDSDHLWPAYCAWVDSGAHTTESNGTGIVSDFLEAFQGEYDTFRDFADEFVESTGMLTNVSEDVARYFDYDGFASDLKYDYTVQDAPNFGVFIYRNN